MGERPFRSRQGSVGKIPIPACRGGMGDPCCLRSLAGLQRGDGPCSLAHESPRWESPGRAGHVGGGKPRCPRPGVGEGDRRGSGGTPAGGRVARAACVRRCPATLAWVPGPPVLKPNLNPGLREARLSGQFFPGGDAWKAILLEGSQEQGGLGPGDGGPLSPAFLRAAFPGPGPRFPPVLPQLARSLVLKPNLDPGLRNADGLGQLFPGGDARVRVPLKAGSQGLPLARGPNESPSPSSSSGSRREGAVAGCRESHRGETWPEFRGQTRAERGRRAPVPLSRPVHGEQVRPGGRPSRPAALIKAHRLHPFRNAGGAQGKPALGSRKPGPTGPRSLWPGYGWGRRSPGSGEWGGGSG